MNARRIKQFALDVKDASPYLLRTIWFLPWCCGSYDYSKRVVMMRDVFKQTSARTDLFQNKLDEDRKN